MAPETSEKRFRTATRLFAILVLSMGITRGFGGIPDSIAMSYAERDRIKLNTLSSLVTGTLVGTTLGAGLFLGGGMPNYFSKSSERLPLAIGSLSLLGAASYFATRKILSVNGEKRLYNYSYMGLFPAILFPLTFILVGEFEKETFNKGEDLFIPVIALSTSSLAAFFGGRFGYKFGHKMWLAL